MFRFSLPTILLFGAISLSAQQPGNPPTLPNSTPPPNQAAKSVQSTDILAQELPNLKSDLAELRAMLNVLASQESGVDTRTASALQTNRKMWQIVIYRLSELTQRLDELQKQQVGKR